MSAMMSALLEPILLVYDYTLQPLDAFAWTGAPVTLLDAIGAFRLALVMRQLRERQQRAHLAIGRPRETRARTRDIAATLVMVYGGEAVVSPWLGIQPSFMLSGVIPLLFVAAQVAVDALPSVPDLSVTELPAAFIDSFTRAMLVCNLVTNTVITHSSATVSASPWTLLLTSLIAANGGPFFVSLVSLLSAGPMTLTTPPELLPAGWTSTDLWVAPLTTGLFATLTHAQPFFTALHATLFDFFSPVGLANVSYIGAQGKGKLVAVDSDVARSVCVLLLGSCFVTRAVRMFGVSNTSSGSSTSNESNSEEERARMRARQLAAHTLNVGRNDSKKTE